MDQSNDISFEQSLELAMRQVPPAIRAVFSGNQIPNTARMLMQKYSLHVDQSAVLEREIMLLLLGVNDPTQFVANLKEDARLPLETVTGIADDVNDLIFVPLRNEMEHPAPAQAPKAMPPRPAQPQVAQGTPDYTGRMKIQVPSPSPNPPAPPVQKVVMPVTPPAPRPVQTPQMPQRAPIMNPERELPAGEGQATTAPLPPKAALPRQNVLPRPAAPAPAPEMRPVPPPSFPPRAIMPEPPAPRPSASPAPANLPGAFAPPPAQRPPQTPPPARPNYGSTDPYREPFE